MSHISFRLAFVVMAILAVLVVFSRAGLAQGAQTQVERGKYLVTFGGCNDCHTPGYFFGKPDMGRFLGGSEVGFELPGMGVFYGPNLTPDDETGLGKWSTQEIVTAITKGQRPDGRMLAPIMPWHAFANLTPADTLAIVGISQKSAGCEKQSSGTFRPERKADVVRHEDRAARGGGTGGIAPEIIDRFWSVVSRELLTNPVRAGALSGEWTAPCLSQRSSLRTAASAGSIGLLFSLPTSRPDGDRLSPST